MCVLVGREVHVVLRCLHLCCLALIPHCRTKRSGGWGWGRVRHDAMEDWGYGDQINERKQTPHGMKEMEGRRPCFGSFVALPPCVCPLHLPCMVVVVVIPIPWSSLLGQPPSSPNPSL